MQIGKMRVIFALLGLLFLITGCGTGGDDTKKVVEAFAQAGDITNASFVSPEQLNVLGKDTLIVAAVLALLCLIGFTWNLVDGIRKDEEIGDVFMDRCLFWVAMMILVVAPFFTFPVLTPLGKATWVKSGLNLGFLLKSMSIDLAHLDKLNGVAIASGITSFWLYTFVNKLYEGIVALGLPIALLLCLKMRSFRPLEGWIGGAIGYLAMGPVLVTTIKLTSGQGFLAGIFDATGLSLAASVGITIGVCVGLPFIIGLGLMWPGQSEQKPAPRRRSREHSDHSALANGIAAAGGAAFGAAAANRAASQEDTIHGYPPERMKLPPPRTAPDGKVGSDQPPSPTDPGGDGNGMPLGNPATRDYVEGEWREVKDESAPDSTSTKGAPAGNPKPIVINTTPMPTASKSNGSNGQGGRKVGDVVQTGLGLGATVLSRTHPFAAAAFTVAQVGVGAYRAARNGGMPSTAAARSNGTSQPSASGTMPPAAKKVRYVAAHDIIDGNGGTVILREGQMAVGAKVESDYVLYAGHTLKPDDLRAVEEGGN